MTERNEQPVETTLVHGHHKPLQKLARYPTTLLVTGIIALTLLALAARSYRHSRHDARAAFRVSEGAALTHLVQRVDPMYPDIAKQMQVEPTAVYETTIGADGAVTYINAVSCDPLLCQRGIEAIRHWQFRPWIVNGRPQAVSTSLTISFRSPAGR